MQIVTDFKFKIYTWLIALAICVYGFFGSLGHLFSILVVLAILLFDWRRVWSVKLSRDALWLYVGLSFVFYFLLIRSGLTTSLSDLTFAASPMFPVAFVGLIVLLSAKTGLSVAPKAIANFACVGIIGVYIVFFILDALPNGLDIKNTGLRSGGRISLFTGNPIPFSMIVGGLSLLTLVGWHDRTVAGRIFSVSIAGLGAYAATVWAGSRGATLGLAAASPFIIFHLTQSKNWTIVYLGAALALTIALVAAQSAGLMNSSILARIINGFETVLTGTNIDNSNYYRMNMWVSSIAAIGDAPFLGHGLTERFWAIKPHLPDGLNFKFSHSHNDILGSGVSGGLVGLLAALCSFLVMPLYVLLKRGISPDQKYLAFSLTSLYVVIANSNTIYFNDAASSFFAFSVALFYLIRTPQQPKAQAA